VTEENGWPTAPGEAVQGTIEPSALPPAWLCVWIVVQPIEQTSSDVFLVSRASLSPALHESCDPDGGVRT